MISKKVITMISVTLCGCLILTGCGNKETAVDSSEPNTAAAAEDGTVTPTSNEDSNTTENSTTTTDDSTVPANGKTVRKEGIPNIVTNFSEQEWKQYGANLRKIAKEETRFDDFVGSEGQLDILAYMKANDFVTPNKEVAKYETREDGSIKFVNWSFIHKTNAGSNIKFSRGYKKTGGLGEFGYRIQYKGDLDGFYVGVASTRKFEDKGVSAGLAISGYEYADNMENLAVIVYNTKHDKNGECLFAHCGIEHTLSPRAASVREKTERTTEFHSKDFPDIKYIIDNKTGIHLGCEH